MKEEQGGIDDIITVLQFLKEQEEPSQALQQRVEISGCDGSCSICSIGGQCRYVYNSRRPLEEIPREVGSGQFFQLLVPLGRTHVLATC